MADPIDTIMQHFALKGGAEYTIGEPITQTEHALQSADLAVAAGASDSLVAAALLHDYGHFLHDFPVDAAEQGIDTRHEDIGADALHALFGPAVAEPVRLHVAAKRYLCTTRPDYFARLSPASVLSLGLQGGLMNAEEVRAFEANPWHRDAVALRFWDEAAKREDAVMPPLESWRPLLERLLAG